MARLGAQSVELDASKVPTDEPEIEEEDEGGPVTFLSTESVPTEADTKPDDDDDAPTDEAEEPEKSEEPEGEDDKDEAEKPEGEDDEDGRYAKLGRTWAESITQNPENTLTKLAEALETSSPGFKARLVQMLGGAVGEGEAAKTDELVAESPVEERLLKHMKHIEALPDLATRADTLEADLLGLAVTMRAQQDVLAAYMRDIAGVALPKFDPQAVFQHVQTHKCSIEDAYKAVYATALEKAVSVAKGRKASAPTTVRNGSGASTTRKKTRSLMEAFDEVSRELAGL